MGSHEAILPVLWDTFQLDTERHGHHGRGIDIATASGPVGDVSKRMLFP